MNVPPDEIELRAGMHEFDKFGEFNVIYSLAGGDFTKFDAAFNLEYRVAYETLKHKAEEARYQKRLNKLLQQESK